MPVSTSQTLNQELAVSALLEMAKQRGLHASRHEAELAWGDVVVKHEEDRLNAAWRRLFKGHSVASCPLRLITDAQLPAWVIADGCIGILTKTATSEEPAKVDWVDNMAPDA